MGQQSPTRWSSNEKAFAGQILHAKIDKLEQLVRLKDAKIELLIAKLQTAGLT